MLFKTTIVAVWGLMIYLFLSPALQLLQPFEFNSESHQQEAVLPGKKWISTTSAIFSLWSSVWRWRITKAVLELYPLTARFILFLYDKFMCNEQLITLFQCYILMIFNRFTARKTKAFVIFIFPPYWTFYRNALTGFSRISGFVSS